MNGNLSFGLWTLIASLLACGRGFGATPGGGEQDYYRLETYTLPPELKLEVSGLARLPDGRMAVAIRKGEIWILESTAELSQPRFTQFASGLHEPLGLAFHEGDLYTVQRTELTRLRDRDGNGKADEYRSVARGWGVTGNYHEYAYGPVFDTSGNAWLTLNCSIGRGTRPEDNAWRGWSIRVDRSGSWRPVSGGFRSPSGLGTNLRGDVFATDQQGNWFPTCCLIHIQPGTFHGHADALQFTSLPEATFQLEKELPQGLSVVEAAAAIDAYQLPAVWFPYRKMGMSTTDLLCDDTAGAFGPFEGQFFVGEFTQSFVSRVFLERVNGVYQGACFRFREGLQSAALRLAWTEDGALLVGESNRGWNSLGNRRFGLQRIVPTGRLPFEIKAMRATSTGFQLEFTKAIGSDLDQGDVRFSISSYTYPYHAAYGGNEIEKRLLEIVSIRASHQRRDVELEVAGLRPGFVHELEISGLESSDGDSLLHATAYYTLNEIPVE